MPLLAKIRRHDDENPPLPFRPLLGNHESRFDGLAKADFIGQQRAFGKRRLERKKRRIDLMRIEINLGLPPPQRAFQAVGRAALGQLVSEIFGVVGG